MNLYEQPILSFTELQDDPIPSTSREFEHAESFFLSRPEPLAGIIESLQMTNFMCHSNLELKLNKRVNFITGRNGSGKSAIIAAIVVVLGGAAAATGRASGVADFIKKGETWARVSITLTNVGINAYKRDIFGDRIIIVRNLSKSSSNTYVIKSAAGTVVARKKEEVDNIILALNLQIRNPICILNQDTARTFLCTSDDTLRFSLFAKATQLEYLKSIYMKTLELLIAAKKQLQLKEKGIDAAGRDIARLKEKLTIFASMEKHIHERTSLENEYFWALVADEEKNLTVLNDERNSLEEKRVELTAADANYEEIIQNLKEEVKNIEENLKQARESTSTKSAERNETQKEAQNIEREIEKTQTSLKNLMGKVEKQATDIDGIKEHLAQSDSLVSQSRSERQAAIAKIRRIEGDLEDVRQRLSEVQTQHDKVQELKLQLTRTLENVKLDLGAAEQNKKRLETLLNTTKAANQNNLLKYGPFTPELIAAIDDAAKKNCFAKKPVGPCGLYVCLTGDPKWARAVESVVSSLMCSYCCDNQKDFQALLRIMDRVCGAKQPSIIISKFLRTRHNVEPNRVQVRGFLSVLDVLTFENDIVFNCFIDQMRIETILLLETDSQAASLMSQPSNVPKHLKMGVTIQSDQYYPAPNYRTYYGDSRRPLKFFEKKALESIMSLEKELTEACLKVHERSSEITKTRKEYTDAVEAIRGFEKKIRDYKHRERKLQLEYNHLKDIEESRPVTVTRMALEEELENLQKTHDEAMQKVAECKGTLESLNQQKEDLVVKLNNLASTEQGSETEIAELERKLEERKYKLKQTTAKRQGSEKEVWKIERKLNDIEEEITKSERLLEEKIKSAQDVCSERVNTERSPCDVQKLLEKCEKYLRTAENMAGSREATIVEYKNKVELFNSMRKTEGALGNAIETLTRIALKKEQRLEVLQSHTASLVSFYFQATLQTRGYDGQLRIDFNDKILEIEVKPKESISARKDPKSLSGGERSYSTVSFILAIWKVVHMPIYFLDEFDVFMDKVNRKVIMELLLEHATVQHNKQFVFITPQDLSNITSSDVVSVFKLPDPQRRMVL